MQVQGLEVCRTQGPVGAAPGSLARGLGRKIEVLCEVPYPHHCLRKLQQRIPGATWGGRASWGGRFSWGGGSFRIKCELANEQTLI